MTKNTGTKKAKESNEPNQSTITKGQDRVADTLSNTAESIHSKADTAKAYLSSKAKNAEDLLRKKTYEAGDRAQQTIGKGNELGHKTAEALSRSSEYIRDFDANQAKDQMLASLKRRPEMTLTAVGLFALAIGFLVGRRSR